MFPIVYSSETCQPCKELKAWLTANNIPFTEASVGDAITKGYRSVPVLEHRGEVVFGFNKTKLKEMFPE